MSDFGSFLTTTKNDGGKFSSSEVSQLCAALQRIITKNDYTTTLDEPFSSDLELSSDQREASVPLSEYYHSGDFGVDEEVFDFVVEVEGDYLLEIITLMSPQFTAYTFKGAVEEW